MKADTADITYLPMRRGFVYLRAVVDWASRRVLAWRLSNTLTSDFCVEAIQEALTHYGTPDIFNTDQGSQFTSLEFTTRLNDDGIQISMDGTGCWRDNVFVERLWRRVKDEEVYLHTYDGVSAAQRGLARYPAVLQSPPATPSAGWPYARRGVPCRGARTAHCRVGQTGEAPLRNQDRLSKQPGPLLLEEGSEFSSHSAVHAAFGERFAKTGRVNPAFHRYLLDAHRARQSADYDAPADVSRDDAETLVSRAEEFLRAVKQLLSGGDAGQAAERPSSTLC
jgi:transposase InsO family protein